MKKYLLHWINLKKVLIQNIADFEQFVRAQMACVECALANVTEKELCEEKKI